MASYRPGTPIIDRRTGQVIGVTGITPGAIYKNGTISGYINPAFHQVRTGVTSPTTQPDTTPFVSREAVVGTEDVRNLPYGTTATNRLATSPTQYPGATAPVASPMLQSFDVQAYIDSQIQAYLEAQKAKPPSTPEEIQKWIYDHYGYMAAYINHPEIGPILQRAAQMEITSEAQLFGMLSATEWWKTTSEVSRRWDYLVNTDPAEAQRQREARGADIRNLAGTLGVGLDGDLNDFSDRAMRAGWSDDQITDYLISLVEGQTAYSEGALGALQNEIRSAAAQFLIDISDVTSSNYARRIASGELTVEGAASVFAQQARARFPWLAETIDRGLTPADFFMPMRDQLARYMEMNPDAIDIMDPKWLGMMEVTDARSGERRAATDFELLSSARGLPEHYKTNYAQSLYADLALGLGQRLGAL